MEENVVQIHGMSLPGYSSPFKEPWITFPTSSGGLPPKAVGVSPTKTSQTEILGTWAFCPLYTLSLTYIPPHVDMH